MAGSDVYYLSAPLFDRAEVDLEDGTLTILAPGASYENQVITGIRLNGEPLEAEWVVRHGQLAGATLEFDLEAAND